MLIETNRQRLLEYLFRQPTAKVHARELARRLKISPPAVLANARELQKEGLARMEKNALTIISANIEDSRFIWMKRVYNIYALYASGLVAFLEDAYSSPRAIAVFGSFSRGEDTEKSDIDIAVITEKRLSMDLLEFENKLKRDINLHEFMKQDVSANFWNNVSNGMVLSGALP